METVETRFQHLTVNDAEDDCELPLVRGVQLNPDKGKAELQRYLVSLGRARSCLTEITPELSRRANIRFPKPVENHHQMFGCRISREWISAIGKSVTEPHLERLKLDFVDQSQSVMMGLYYMTALTSIPLEIDFAILPSPEPGEELPDIESHLVLESGEHAEDMWILRICTDDLESYEGRPAQFKVNRLAQLLKQEPKWYISFRSEGHWLYPYLR
ncbi:hypothetical protein BC834DRAFT_1034268 [Gloeopeniophorella convolvens]|nr:hypothetical protein BC834DRAFT_1034268 [Gloeopeniophorella convolvens]